MRPRRSRTWFQRTALIVPLLVVAMLGTSVAASAPVAAEPTSVVDSETVYAICDATGALSETIVVDWLQVEGDGPTAIADPVAVTSVESLTDGFAPSVSEGAVHATVDITGGHGDYFYRTTTEQQLPLEVSATYFLDGVRTAPGDLAGRNGRLRIEYSLHNTLERAETISYADAAGVTRTREETYTVPLLCIPQIKLDGTRFTNVEAPADAQLAITGTTHTYAIPMVPSPDATAAIEMDASDIKLDAVVVTVFPKLPASPDFSVADELADLREGLDGLAQLSAGHLEIVNGMREGMADYDVSEMAGAAEGLTELGTGLAAMQSAAGDLALLADGQYAYLDGVIGGIDTSQFDSLGELTSGITSMTVAASELASGTAGLVTLLDGQIALAGQIQALNTANVLLADDLWAIYPADSNVLALQVQLHQEDAMLSALLDGGDLGGGYMPGLRYTRDQLAAIADGMTQLADGLAQIEAQSAALTAIPAAFTQLRDALIVLRDGGTLGSEYLPGLDVTAQGLHGLADGLGAAAAGLAASSGDLAMLEDVPTLMGDLSAALDALSIGGELQGHYVPGISTTADGLTQMSDGLGEGLDEIRAGEALTDAMKRAAEEYDTFLGKPEGATGRLNFLIRLEGIGVQGG